MKVCELLAKGRDFLDGRENASLESEVLLAELLGESKEYLFAYPEEEVDAVLEQLLMIYLGRLKEGEPLAYLLNKKEFFGMDLFVDKRVLIPRPETEQLVERVLEYLKADEGRTYRVLDVGTGSGNIAVALGAIELVSDVLALDISDDALDVAKINVEQYSLESKIQLAQSDLLEAVEDGESFDAIVANLPYIGKVKNRYVSESSEKFEPGDALFGGDNGLELYKNMFKQIVGKSVEFEILVGEFGFAQGDEMRELLSEFFYQTWSIERDLAGIERIFIVKNYAG